MHVDDHGQEQEHFLFPTEQTIQSNVSMNENSYWKVSYPTMKPIYKMASKPQVNGSQRLLSSFPQTPVPSPPLLFPFLHPLPSRHVSPRVNGNKQYELR